MGEKLTDFYSEKEVPVFRMGEDTLKVPVELFAKNRSRLRSAMLDSVAGLNQFPFIFLEGGKILNVYSTDMAQPFRQEPFFHWMFGVVEPGFCGGYEIRNGLSFLFIPRVTRERAIFQGHFCSLQEVKRRYKVDFVYYIDELGCIFEKNPNLLLYLLTGVNSDSRTPILKPTLAVIDSQKVDVTTLHPIICECRVIKTPEEIRVMKYVNKITSEAHKMIMSRRLIGLYEYQIEAIFQHYCWFIGGCKHMSSTPNCATGPNTSILQYGRPASLGRRCIQDGDMCLFDMGCVYHGYCSDVCSSYPANGKFTELQATIYNVVYQMRDNVLEIIRPGVAWTACHEEACRTLLKCLKEAKILQGSVSDMWQDGVDSIFFPSGIGHLIGCDQHDVGGFLPGEQEMYESSFRFLRTNRILKEGMVLSVEPGCYFISALIDDALKSDVLGQYFNEKELARYMGIGGIRIEDNVVVTSIGAQVLTQIPRKIEEIEELMSKRNPADFLDIVNESMTEELFSGSDLPT